jgi:outer membrane protein assembly factor BamB
MNHSAYVCGLTAATLFSSVASTGPAIAQSAVSLTSQSPRSLTGVRFHFVADGPVRGGFGVASGRLLFGTEAGTAYAIDEKSGAVRWRHSLGSPVLSTPAVVGAVAYFTTWDNRLHAIDAATGRERWTRDLGRTRGPNDYWEYYVSSPQTAGSRLYVGSGSGSLFAIEADSGRIIWSFDAGERIRTTPALTADAEIIGTMAGEVIAVDRGGRQRWRFKTVGAGHGFSFKSNDTRSVVTQPIVVGNVVIAGGRDGNIYGIDLKTGTERWHETHDGGSWILGLAADNARFYAGSGSAFVMQAAEPSTGKEIWRTPTANAMFGGIAKAGEVLVSNGINGMIAAFDSASGAQQWRFSLPSTVFSSPLVAQGVVFTGADDGSIYALDTSSAAPAAFDRALFSYTDEPAQSAFWFKPEAKSAIRGAFLAAGYSDLGNAGLVEALASPVTKKGRRIIVLADSRLPDEVKGDQLRSFLDHGGTLVMLGIDPLVYGYGANGSPETVDEDKAKAAFGIDPQNKERDNGYNVSTFNAAGERLGLSGRLVAVGWVNPEQITTILARDRSGNATAWIKRFANGGSLIQLPVPRNRSGELSQYVNAVDLAAQNGSRRPLKSKPPLKET